MNAPAVMRGRFRWEVEEYMTSLSAEVRQKSAVQKAGLALIWAERPGHPDGDIAVLRVRGEAVPSVREAALLQQVTGAQASVALNDQGEVTAAWTVES